MTAYKHLKTFLGYGGEGQVPSPQVNHQRTGLNFPPTHRELLEYALYLSDTYDGDGTYPHGDLIK